MMTLLMVMLIDDDDHCYRGLHFDYDSDCSLDFDCDDEHDYGRSYWPKDQFHLDTENSTAS